MCLVAGQTVIHLRREQRVVVRRRDRERLGAGDERYLGHGSGRDRVLPFGSSKRSRAPKKKRSSRTIGPPIDPPYSHALERRFGGAALLEEVLGLQFLIAEVGKNDPVTR